MPTLTNPLETLLAPISPEDFRARSWGRAALYVAGSPGKARGLPSGSALEGLVHGLCAQLERPGRVGGEWLLSVDEQGTDWQVLGRHAFVIQLEGSKCWQFGSAPGEAPPALGALREELLAAGDVLYLPPGSWWRTFPLERSSALSVLLGPTGGEGAVPG